jgi:hypothetical protein
MKIENWRKHLKLMRNGYYEVDGVIGQLLRYRPIGNKGVNIKLSTRSYDIMNEDAPYTLANWRPINDDNKTAYDHIAAEQKMQSKLEVIEPEVMASPDPEVEHLTVNHKQPAVIDHSQESLQEAMESQYKGTMDAMVKGALFANEELRKTILRLKGDKGKEFVSQAKQIVNAINAARNIRDSVNDYFKTGISLMKEQNKQNPKSNAQKTGNDLQED